VHGRDDLRQRLLAAYDDPHRGYHDRRHLTEVLHHVATILREDPPPDVDPDAVLLAAWFHDAVYQGGGDDEDRSAALAESELSAAGVDVDLVAETGRLVRLTTSHAVADGDGNAAVLCDADLAILAASPKRYEEYVAGVRTEYAGVTDTDFARGRAAVLRALADQPHLFHTGYGRSRWEEPARANLARELARLGQAVG